MLITTTVKNRRRIFDDEAFAREAIETLYRVQKLHPFILFGFVIMPDHCHLLVYVPAPESISTIMRVFKYGLTFNLGIGAFWQARFHIGLPKNPQSSLWYIHHNPVRAGLAEKLQDYPWSSGSGRWKVARLDDFYRSQAG
ncbi:MAG: transposase [Candidatus Peribacteria bacterium]|nr:transposase [Candidatus Peribacteria bacterium]